MLKRNFILLFAIMAIVGNLSAQVRPGVKMGYNLVGVMANNYQGVYSKPPSDKVEEYMTLRKTNPGDPDNFHVKSGFQAGMIADCPINERLAIQPGVRFAMQGFTDEYKNTAKHIRKFSMYYLQIPVYAQYRMPVAEDVNLLFQAGPYASFGLLGRQNWIKNTKSQLGDGDDKYRKISFGNGTDNDLKTFDYGLSAGVGVELFRFQFVAAYDFGLAKTPFIKDAKSGKYNVDIRNHNFSITVGVVFGRRDPLQKHND